MAYTILHIVCDVKHFFWATERNNQPGSKRDGRGECLRRSAGAGSVFAVPMAQPRSGVRMQPRAQALGGEWKMIKLRRSGRNTTMQPAGPGMTGFAGHTDCDSAAHMLLNFCP